jgi:hypothetical protein
VAHLSILKTNFDYFMLFVNKISSHCVPGLHRQCLYIGLFYYWTSELLCCSNVWVATFLFGL